MKASACGLNCKVLFNLQAIFPRWQSDLDKCPSRISAWRSCHFLDLTQSLKFVFAGYIHPSFRPEDQISNPDAAFRVGTQASYFELKDVAVLIFKLQMLDIRSFLITIPEPVPFIMKPVFIGKVQVQEMCFSLPPPELYHSLHAQCCHVVSDIVLWPYKYLPVRRHSKN